MNKLVILDGNIGSGKSKMIEHILKKLKKESNFIRIYIDNTTDLKSLIGCYVCSDKIGQFEWKNGPLIIGMRKGSIILLENFQEANEEIIQALILLKEKNVIEINGENINPEFGFKIICLSNFSLKTENGEFKKIGLMNNACFFEKKDFFSYDLWNICEVLFYNLKDTIIFDFVKKLWDICQKSEIISKNAHLILKFLNRIDYFVKKTYGNEIIHNLTEKFRNNVLSDFADLFLFKNKEGIFHEETLKILSEHFQIPFHDVFKIKKIIHNFLLFNLNN